MKRRYKVLPLCALFLLPKQCWRNAVQEKNRIQPIFNRNGQYYDRMTDKAWIEVDGEAWIYGNKETIQSWLQADPPELRARRIEILIRFMRFKKRYEATRHQ